MNDQAMRRRLAKKNALVDACDVVLRHLSRRKGARAVRLALQDVWRALVNESIAINDEMWRRKK